MHATDGSLSVRKTSESTELALDEFNGRIRPDDPGDGSLSVIQLTTKTWEIRVNRNHERLANEAEIEDAYDDRRTAIF
jgi:hypothetical protein